MIHVSGLASHTSDMRGHPRVSLLVIAPEAPGVPPQARARITVQGTAREITRIGSGARGRKGGVPSEVSQSAPTFQLADFALFGIQPSSIRFIAGFAQAVTLTPEAFAAAC